MSKEGDNQIWGPFGIFLGLFMIFGVSNLFQDEKAFKLISGELKENVEKVENSGRRGQTEITYEFKLKNFFYKKLTFTNSALKEIKSEIDYEELLKKNTKVRMHVFKKELRKKRWLEIYSLEVEGEKIVELDDRAFLDWKRFLIGVVMVLIGLYMTFTIN